MHRIIQCIIELQVYLLLLLLLLVIIIHGLLLITSSNFVFSIFEHPTFLFLSGCAGNLVYTSLILACPTHPALVCVLSSLMFHITVMVTDVADIKITSGIVITRS